MDPMERQTEKSIENQSFEIEKKFPIKLIELLLKLNWFLNSQASINEYFLNPTNSLELYASMTKNNKKQSIQ